jgi:hypothetical protein
MSLIKRTLMAENRGRQNDLQTAPTARGGVSEVRTVSRPSQSYQTPAGRRGRCEVALHRADSREPGAIAVAG